MCGRYTLFSEEENEDIRNIIRDVQQKCDASKMKTGEIFPTDHAPVLIGSGRKAEPELMGWGYPSFNGKGVIINVRAETAPEKPMFRRGLQQCRCLIPSTGFFEWTHSGVKEKYRFNMSGTAALYMAGIYSVFDSERRFVILTTAANESMVAVHSRMPVVVPEDRREDWLFDESCAQLLLKETPPLLEKRRADTRPASLFEE